LPLLLCPQGDDALDASFRSFDLQRPARPARPAAQQRNPSSRL